MCVWNSVWVWFSYWSFWQIWSFISGDKISCKHYPKWNAYTCSLKYRVVLKCSRNETSCEQDLLSRRFEISHRYEFISPLVWMYSYLIFYIVFEDQIVQYRTLLKLYLMKFVTCSEDWSKSPTFDKSLLKKIPFNNNFQNWHMV